MEQRICYQHLGVVYAMLTYKSRCNQIVTGIISIKATACSIHISK
jgi:hypothetical protein